MFIESPRFPEVISSGSTGGPSYKTNVAQTASGYEYRDSTWGYPLHVYDIVYGIKNFEDMETLIAFFHTVKGRAYGFRYKDPIDYKSCVFNSATAFDDQVIGVGNGNTVSFQLYKIYLTGVYQLIRIINKPVVDTLLVGIAGVQYAHDADPGGWSINYATGIITFNAAPANGVIITAGYEFDVPVRFDSDRFITSFAEYDIASTQIELKEIKI